MSRQIKASDRMLLAAAAGVIALLFETALDVPAWIRVVTGSFAIVMVIAGIVILGNE